jgi:hypothetical protein
MFTLLHHRIHTHTLTLNCTIKKIINHHIFYIFSSYVRKVASKKNFIHKSEWSSSIIKYKDVIQQELFYATATCHMNCSVTMKSCVCEIEGMCHRNLTDETKIDLINMRRFYKNKKQRISYHKCPTFLCLHNYTNYSRRSFTLNIQDLTCSGLTIFLEFRYLKSKTAQI